MLMLLSLALAVCDGQRVVLSSSPFRAGTLLVEMCAADPELPTDGDYQVVRFVPNAGDPGWTRALGVQRFATEVWWSTAVVTAYDVDGDDVLEVVLRGELSNCGTGGCVAGTASLVLWPDRAEGGGDCGRRGFEEGSRARLLVWENARFDVPGWVGPSWVRSTLTRGPEGRLVVDEVWTALPPAQHEVVTYRSSTAVGAAGLAQRCPAAGTPGLP